MSTVSFFVVEYSEQLILWIYIFMNDWNYMEKILELIYGTVSCKNENSKINKYFQHNKWTYSVLFNNYLSIWKNIIQYIKTVSDNLYFVQLHTGQRTSFYFLYEQFQNKHLNHGIDLFHSFTQTYRNTEMYTLILNV